MKLTTRTIPTTLCLQTNCIGNCYWVLACARLTSRHLVFSARMSVYRHGVIEIISPGPDV